MGWQEEYQQKIAALLERWQASLKDMQHALPNLPAQRRELEAHRLHELESLLRDAQAHLALLTSSDTAQWEFHHQAVERAMINFKRILDGFHPPTDGYRTKSVKKTQSQLFDR